VKILQVCFSSGWGGLEKYSVWLASALKKRGHDIHYLARSGATIEKEALKDRLTVHSVRECFSYYLDFPLMFQIRKIISSGGFDAVHIHMSKDLGLAVPALWGMDDVKLFFSLHMIVPAPKKDIYHRMQYARVKKIFALGEEGERSAVENLPIAKERVMELPYGLEVDRYRPVRSASLRKELGMGENTIVLGMLSRIEPLKGQMEAIRAMPLVLKQFPDALLLLVGDETEHMRGKIKPGLEEEIRKLALGSNVKFLGYRSDIPEVMGLFDLFLLPSHFESYSISVIEAKLCGVPVVAASSGGVPQNLGHGEYGILVEPKSHMSLAEGIIKTLGDPSAAKARADKARESALVRYDNNRILDIIEKEYSK